MGRLQAVAQGRDVLPGRRRPSLLMCEIAKQNKQTTTGTLSVYAQCLPTPGTLAVPLQYGACLAENASAPAAARAVAVGPVAPPLTGLRAA